MSERLQTKVIVGRTGLIIFVIFTLLGCYLLIRAFDPNNPPYSFLPSILFLIGGPSLLIGLLGVFIFILLLIRTTGGLTRKFLGLGLLAPGTVLALTFTIALVIKPLDAKHVKFQSGLGKKNFRSIDMEASDLRWIALTGADLTNANLENANLYRASLKQANLSGANLQGTNLKDANLEDAILQGAIVDDASLLSARYMRDAIIPDGSKYDGRFFLKGDLIALSNSEEWLGDNSCDIDRIAAYYHVSTNDFLNGMQWSLQNLSEVSTKIGSLGGFTNQGQSFIHADFSDMDLRNSDYNAADFQYADFAGADLSGAQFVNANLCGAKITDEQLCKSSKLKGATMPDGNKYDGRYNLSGDLSVAEGHIKSLNKNPGPKELAEHYYYISVEDYLAGQEWAEESLDTVCADVKQ